MKNKAAQLEAEGQVQWIVPSWIEAQISGAKYAQVTTSEIKLVYLNDTTEARKRTKEPLPQNFFGIVSFVQEGRQQ